MGSQSQEFVCTIGAFDGVHMGHRKLIASTLADAAARNCRSLVLTFAQDPAWVLSPTTAPKHLLSVPDRVQLLKTLRPDEVACVPFDAQVAALPYERFVHEQLGSFGTLRALHVGSDFCMGAAGAGTPERLAELGELDGFEVVVEPYTQAGGERVSSTRIRKLVEAGEVEQARELLLRPHSVTGHVVHGRGEGTAFGFPTANVAVDETLCLPAEGVYGGYLSVGNTSYPAAINVGKPKSLYFAEQAGAPFLEAFLLGFSGDLYDAEVRVSFVHFIRPPKVFASIEELETTVLANIEEVRQTLGESAVSGREIL